MRWIRLIQKRILYEKTAVPIWAQPFFSGSNCGVNLCSVSLFKTSRAYVTGRFLTIFNVGYLLNVCLKGSSRLTVGVAYVVTARLALTANITYSGHINTSEF